MGFGFFLIVWNFKGFLQHTMKNCTIIYNLSFFPMYINYIY